MFQPSLLEPAPAWFPTLLQALARYRVLRCDQLAALLEQPLDTLSAALAPWIAHGVLIAVGPAFMPSGASTGAVVLSGAGATLARQALQGRPVRAVNPHRIRLFLDHELAVADVGVVFEQLHRRNLVEVLRFDTDRGRLADAAWLFRQGRALRIPLVADALVLVRDQDRTLALLVEVDRGTIARARLQQRYEAYLSWWREGGPARQFGLSSLRVLTLAPSLARLQSLRGAAMAATQNAGSGLFWFALQGIFDPSHPERALSSACTVARDEEAPLQPLFPNTLSRDSTAPMV